MKNTEKSPFGAYLSVVSADLKSYLKPAAVSLSFVIIALGLSSVLCLKNGGIPRFLYIILMISTASFGLVSALSPSFSLLGALRSGAYPKMYPESAVAFGKITSAALCALCASLLHAGVDLTLSLLSESIGDEYRITLLYVSVLIFAVVFYLSSVMVTAAADDEPSSRNPRRRIFMSGVLLYALGIAILTLSAVIVSGISFGSDITSLFIPSEASLSLSLIYLFVCVIRIMYLFLILRRRIGRQLRSK